MDPITTKYTIRLGERASNKLTFFGAHMFQEQVEIASHALEGARREGWAVRVLSGGGRKSLAGKIVKVERIHGVKHVAHRVINRCLSTVYWVSGSDLLFGIGTEVVKNKLAVGNVVYIELEVEGESRDDLMVVVTNIPIYLRVA